MSPPKGPSLGSGGPRPLMPISLHPDKTETKMPSGHHLSLPAPQSVSRPSKHLQNPSCLLLAQHPSFPLPSPPLLQTWVPVTPLCQVLQWLPTVLHTQTSLHGFMDPQTTEEERGLEHTLPRSPQREPTSHTDSAPGTGGPTGPLPTGLVS